MRKQVLAILSAALVSATAISACGVPTTGGESVPEATTEAAGKYALDTSDDKKENSDANKSDDAGRKVLRFGQGNAGDGLDMQVSTSSRAASIADEITESLLRFNEDNVEVPVLVTAFPTISDDGLTYSFELKEGVHFTNGAELKASDVKFTFERMFTPATGAKSTAYFKMIKGAQDMLDGKATELAGFEIQDDYHFTITLDYAFAPFIKNIATSYADIFPEEACKEAGDKWGFGTDLIGTGPYKIDTNDDTTGVTLVKNDDYHAGDVNLDEIDFVYFDDDQTKLIAYENGDIDLADVNPALLSQYQETNASEITAYHPLGTAFMSLNLKADYISDINVRKAISLAINREELVDTILNGAGIPASSFLNNNIPGHDDSLSVYEYNPEEAKKLLEEAGYGDGITIDAEVRQADQTVFAALQGYLDEVGITLNLNVVDNATWTADRTAGKIPVTGMTWNALYPDGDFQMYNYFYSTNSVAQGVFYENADFDKAMDDARVSTDENKRAELYKKADKLLSQDDYACIPLYYPQSQFIAKPYVKNYKVGNLIYHFFDVDIDADAKAKA
ncbi:ABC transporter substrate-binding protein [Oribacterium sp. WCC10]|uniref:ABC transporter substrate-binding protein n=1 Tax=Oribacterium sp. WCC10 TaxID=1855343 RepID=UPI0008E86B07|nr:ABC transporter substrate-binding protein [Oribacterium sp. WCC10]SFG76567.1 peptide/nickel transport system substrate-binding protein [Oribacterium sp. WCC10]